MLSPPPNFHTDEHHLWAIAEYMLFRFRVYIKSWATMNQFPKLLAQLVTRTNFSKVHIKIVLKNCFRTVEKIVKAMDSMSMKSFLQSICYKISAMVKGNAAVYSSMREVKRSSMSPERYYEKKNYWQKENKSFSKIGVYFSDNVSSCWARRKFPWWNCLWPSPWLIVLGDLWLRADPGSYQTGLTTVATATSVFVSGNSCSLPQVQFIYLPLQTLCFCMY